MAEQRFSLAALTAIVKHLEKHFAEKFDILPPYFELRGGVVLDHGNGGICAEWVDTTGKIVRAPFSGWPQHGPDRVEILGEVYEFIPETDWLLRIEKADR